MEKSLVSIVIGSDSDIEIMKSAAEILEELDIAYEFTIASGHRTPERVYRIAVEAEVRGIEVFIAGAGGSAHLPGLIASLATLPVIGVPIMTGSLGGVDALYSMVQMPSGIPVASMGINGAKNAGLMAASILAIKDDRIKSRLKDYRDKLRESVESKGEKIERSGWRDY